MVRSITRICKLYRAMTRRKALAVPIRSRELAHYLGISYETFIRKTGVLADLPGWVIKAYGFVLFERQTPHETAPCGTPRYYIISRYYADSEGIGGAPGKVRARLRHKAPSQWIAHLKKIEKLCLGILLRGKDRANDKHNGSPTGRQDEPARARPPPKTNRPALRRYDEMAGAVAAAYRNIPAAPDAIIFGWARHRLHEQHSFERIMACLRHAVAVMPQVRYRPVNPPGWICQVAWRHLDRDGLAPVQRKRDAIALKAGRHPAGAGTFKDGLQSGDFKSTVSSYGQKTEGTQDTEKTEGTGTVWARAYREREAKRLRNPWD